MIFHHYGTIVGIFAGSLSMSIKTNNPFDNDRKANHDMIYRNKLLRTKKQKSIEGAIITSCIIYYYTQLLSTE